MISIILICIIFIVSITLHEISHGIVAKLLGFDVKEISTGYGYSLFKFNFKDIIFNIRMIPLGGYSRIEDIDEEGKNKKENRILSFKKIIIYLSGPLSDLILAFILFAMVNISFSGIEIDDIQKNQFTGENNIEKGYRISRIDNETVKLNESKDRTVQNTITIINNKDQKEIIPIDSPKTLEALGIELKNDSINTRINNSIDGINNLNKGFINLFSNILKGNNIDDNKQAKDSMSNQLKISNEKAQGRLNGFLLFFGLFNYAVMIINLIPLPVLDGGRILISIIELIYGRYINGKFINIIMWLSIFILLFVEIYLRVFNS